MENKKVIAVIVTYNRKELLKEAIEALLNQNYKNCDILIVDNASTDGTQEYISNLLKNNRVIYKNTGANLGGAGGFNYGIKEACEIGCDFVWVMDDDCIVHNDTLEKFIEADMELNGNYGYLSSKVLWKDGKVCKMNVQRKTLTKNVINFNEKLQEICMASFVSLFIKTEIVAELGLPIKDFFIWTDDWEYTRRISKKYKCYLVTDSIVTHKSKNNIAASIDKDSLERLDRYSYLYRNDVYLYKREGLKGWTYLIPRLSFHIFKILKSKEKNKLKRIKILLSATKTGMKFNPQIEYLNNKKNRILEVVCEPFSYGGQEKFLINMLGNIKTNNMTIDIFTPFYKNNYEGEKIINAKGGKIIAFNYNFNSKLRKFYIIIGLNKFLKRNKYDIVHIHSGSTFSLAIGAKICKKNNIKNVLVHSHSTGTLSLKYKIIKNITNNIFLKNVDYYLACSKEAAKWKFPSDIIALEKYKVIKNGINLKKFSFNEKVREEYRQKFNIDHNCLVIGNVARMTKEKNQIFLVHILANIRKIYSNCKLIIIGEGKCKNEIIELAEKNNILENIIFLEKRNDVECVLQAMDVFVFPPFFEGLGIVVIEAQAASLPVICSENIPEEANISDLFNKLKLNDGLDIWTNKIIELSKINRINRYEELKETGYDESDSAENLTNIYYEVLKKWKIKKY